MEQTSGSTIRTAAIRAALGLDRYVLQHHRDLGVVIAKSFIPGARTAVHGEGRFAGEPPSVRNNPLHRSSRGIHARRRVGRRGASPLGAKRLWLCTYRSPDHALHMAILTTHRVYAIEGLTATLARYFFARWTIEELHRFAKQSLASSTSGP